MRTYLGATALALSLFTPMAAAQNTSQLAENGWYSDDTRADGSGGQAAGTNLISPLLTDDPEAGASGNAAHDVDIRRQIRFGAAPGTVPAGTHEGAVHLSILAGGGAGKSQISHRKDDGIGHADGADAFGPATSLEYSWMGDGTATVTASLKFGVQTAEFAGTGPSSRTGESTWDKVMIYEPGNLNGGTADGLWHTETIDFTTGRWWFFDRTRGAGSIGNPMTLSDMSTSLAIFDGSTTYQDIYALITAPGAIVSSVQVGIGSGNAGGSIYVNQVETNFYRAGSVTTFGSEALGCDQDVTSAAIFGSGNDNGSFTTARSNGVEIGLRGKLRFDASNLPANVFNSNGDGTYTFETGSPTGGAGWVAPTTPFWNIEWSVNTDWDGSTGDTLDALSYELGMDFDAGPGTDYLVFDPIAPNSVLPFDPPVVMPFWDHSIGTNATGPGAGVEAGDQPTYLGLLAANNLAQNSWSPEFYNDSPFDGFDPNEPGEYSFYLAAFAGATEVGRSEITILVVSPTDFDQGVTPDVIFGSGNVDGSWTTTRQSGIELAMRTKLRFDASNLPANVFNSNGDGTYTFSAGAPTGGAGWVAPTTPFWNIEWSVNTDHDGSSGLVLDDLTYELGMDFDEAPTADSLVFDPISPGSVIPFDTPVVAPFWDHAIGTNATPNGGGTSAPDAPTYLALLAASNVAQNSWSPEFYNEAPFDGFDPNLPGRYDFYLAAKQGGTEVARVEMTVVVTDGTSLVLEADPCQRDADCNLPGVQVAVDLWMRNLGADATGFQAFLAFDDSKLTFEGTASSYSAAPFGTHIQSIGAANVAPGELRLDGNSGFGGPSTAADAKLATLIFTVAAECDPTALSFDLGQPFPSELSFQGTPLSTSLVGGTSFYADATPPLLAPSPDLVSAADASVGNGCESAVVTYPTPVAVDTCSSATVECFPPSGTAFPIGTTTVTCVATDECGNTATETFDVVVTPTNVVSVDLQLVGVSTAITRCIHFVTSDCGVSADIELDFDASGQFVGSVELPCGNWSSVCAKDEQHTLWASTSLSLSGDGTSYIADTPMLLEGGDTDNDGDVDINDVTLFLFQFGQPASAGGCGWDGTRDADFDGNGAVLTADYSFLTANWLSTSGCGCVGALPDGGAGGVRMRVRPVTNPLEARVDFDRNGRIDYRDVKLFEQRFGLPDRLSERMRTR